MKRRAIVSVIGDAGAEEGFAPYDLAREVGKGLVDAGFRVMTGGLGGVMEAASRGAHESAAYREGDTIGILPHADPSQANPWVDIPIPTGLDHARNAIVANADAVIAIGGGAGTLAEMAFAWIYRRLVIGIEISGWSGELGDRRIDGRIRQADVPEDRVFRARTAEDAVKLVIEHLPRYASRHRGFRFQG
jgi:uncharacterized protein (TIGR00725 family)